MTSTYSPNRSPGSSRLQQHGAGSASRLRSSSLKKPPEPLRRAVADCLSSSSASGVLCHGGAPSMSPPEALRNLRDYLAAATTTDLAYSVILEHTVAERERSPAVVARCVALLKRHLLRYKPSEEMLLQIDRFCLNTMAECDVSMNQKSSAWLRSLSQQSELAKTPSSLSTSSGPSPLPVASFASGSLVKSLNYVRSLVALHIPKRSFQPAVFAGATPASRQSLPSLSSLLSRSFSSQLSPANAIESSENNDSTSLTVSNLSDIEEVEVKEDLIYIAFDLLKWRWSREQQMPFLSSEGDRAMNLQDVSKHNLLEVGAAALLVGDMQAKLKGQPRKFFGTTEMPYLDQLLQPASVTMVVNSASARSHLRAITASKRTKTGPRQIWDDSPVSTFRPRPRPLFQYRHYSEQQPLRLNPAEVGEVIAAVCSESSSTSPNLMTVTSRLSNKSGKPSMDVAMSVLVKLIIDMYVLERGIAAPLTLSMLEEMLCSPKAACRVRAFDLVLNLGVHAHLLEPIIIEDTSTIEEDYAQESFSDNENKLLLQGKRKSHIARNSDLLSAIEKFESWIVDILFEILLLLVQMEEKEECVWASALSCLLYFVCDRGEIKRDRLKGLDIRVIKSLLETSRRKSWADIVHSRLVCMLANMFYQVSDPNEPSRGASNSSIFLINQVELIGGVEFIFMEYSLAATRDERRNLYSVLFDYVLHQINETCNALGLTEYTDDEIQPLASLLVQADAPEAFFISVKLGVEGIGELLRRSISAAITRFHNNERLNMLLENITDKFDTIISSFTHLDKEFLHLKQITKSYKLMESIQAIINDPDMKIKLSWATLHSLLHSERITYRQNGYIWLGDLLIAEISEEKDSSIWSSIRNLQHNITQAGSSDPLATSDIPITIHLLCGLLKSRNTLIRWGFLVILERLLMRCKFLLDEIGMKHPSSSDIFKDQGDWQLEKANAVVDVMSSALSLMAQETDHINILKMCDILFSQLCLKVRSNGSITPGDGPHHDRGSCGSDGSGKLDASCCNGSMWKDFLDERETRSSYSANVIMMCETASMAALLLRGEAIVPMQLLSRIPAALFFWPLIQLAGAVTDDIALGVAVGSEGRGNLPGATSDIRATLLLLLIGKCTADPAAFQEEVGGEEFFRRLLDDPDARVAYYSSAFLLKRMMTEEPEKYQSMLQKLVFKAQQSNNEKLLENPYLQMRSILQLTNEL